MYYQLFLQPKPLPRDALFRPMITKGSRTSLAETDYNLHKSNSTYFADLDVGRTMLISCLLRKGIRESSKYRNTDKTDVDDASNTAQPSAKRRRSSISEAATSALRNAASSASEVATAETILRTPHSDPASTASRENGQNSSTPPRNVKKSDRFLIALGGVSCHFKRELKPNEEYEIWTRVLCWDRKWFYLVSHMVKAGAIVPDEYALGASRSFSERLFGARGKKSNKQEKTGQMNGALKELEQERTAQWQSAIFASSISKYVVKKGRLTIPPELVWQRSDLLPKDSDISEQTVQDHYAWTSQNVERERSRGMELAGSFAALDGLVGEFPMSWGLNDKDEDEKEVKVLGSFQDWLVF